MKPAIDDTTRRDKLRDVKKTEINDTQNYMSMLERKQNKKIRMALENT